MTTNSSQAYRNNPYYRTAVAAQQQLRKLYANCTPEEKKLLRKYIHPITPKTIEQAKRLDKKILGGKRWH
jgi:hypothetical protein